MQDSEHEDSEEVDLPQKNDEMEDNDGNDGEDEEMDQRANQYLADSRAMRPYDDDSDQEKPSYHQAGNQPRAAASNRGALKLLAANAGTRAGGAPRETKQSKRNRAHSRNDDFMDSNSSQGYQSRDF